MSSTYQALCMSHDPALPIEGTWSSAADALAAVAERAGDLSAHAGCDLMIGRYSYPLIEVCCPPHDRHPHDGRWVDADWVRIAVAAMDGPGDPLAEALSRLPRCWRQERIHRLRVELGVPDGPA